MKLKVISELQYKFASTALNRAGVSGAYKRGSVQNLFSKSSSSAMSSDPAASDVTNEPFRPWEDDAEETDEIEDESRSTDEILQEALDGQFDQEKYLKALGMPTEQDSDSATERYLIEQPGAISPEDVKVAIGFFKDFDGLELTQEQLEKSLPEFQRFVDGEYDMAEVAVAIARKHLGFLGDIHTTDGRHLIVNDDSDSDDYRDDDHDYDQWRDNGSPRDFDGMPKRSGGIDW